MVLKGRLQKKKHMAGEKYGVERRKNRRGGYEKWIDYEGKQQKNYEKYLCVILFLILHLSDNKQVIPKVWEYEKWIW